MDTDQAPGPRDRPAAAPTGGAAADFLRSRTVKCELLSELRASWEVGEPAEPEALLARWPEGPADDPDVASLLLEDYLQKARREEPLTVDHYAERFPNQRDTLNSLVRRHELLRSLGGSPSSEGGLRLPEIGEELFGFRLHRELGRGAFARVFLAEQTDLAGRPVALKVSSIEGAEPQTLAQLQHTHIVPVFSLHEDRRAGLRALCMPYFGGASLAEVLAAAWERNPRPPRGQELIDALAKAGAPSPERLRGGRAPEAGDAQTPKGLLAALSYVRAVAWLGARLAEGLHHAHQRGILHRDVKPSNVLLGADGQPMLLDFNLAIDSHNQVHAALGGTVAYMSPEHLRALATRDPALAAKVDRRSDVYSLGMVIYEMLVGRRPFEQSAGYAPLPMLVESMALERARAAPSARAGRPDVPWGLESILRRSMAPGQEDRYQSAEELAEDLRRFLADQPLRYAPELSLAERAAKWARRHPRLTSSGAVFTAAAAALLVVALLLAGVRTRLARARDQLIDARARDRKRAFEEGAVRALFLVNTRSDLQDHLREGRKVCEETLSLYGVLDRDDWQAHPEWARLDEGDRGRLAEDARELLLLLAGARVRLAPKDRASLKGALALLDRAEAIPGLPPCRALWEDRAAYREGLGDRAGSAAGRERARQLRPAGARDHYLLALTHSRAGRHDQAIRHLDEALRLAPRHYWSWAQRGLCQQERGEPALAAADFSACVGLWPEFAWGHFNRAGALALCGKREEAVADYTSAIRRDPGLVVAYVNRGLLRLELEQFGPALSDLDVAAARGRDDAFLHAGRAMALERLGRHAAGEEAFRAAWKRAGDAPPEVRARLRWSQGFALAARKPRFAQAAFEQVLKEDPTNVQALYGRGMLLERQGRPEEALGSYARALEASPGFLPARRARAVLLARRGRGAAASREINWCLDQEPRGGTTLYAAACVAALLAREASPEGAGKARDQALEMLRRALTQGYGLDKGEADDDLEALRTDPRFEPLLKEARSLKAGSGGT